MVVNEIGSGLVNYCCYMEDICSISELELPWTKPYLAFILFTRLWKGFQPRVQYWNREGNEKEGMMDFLHDQLANTHKFKSQIKQLYSKTKETHTAFNTAFDNYMNNHGFSILSPLSFYPSLDIQGSNYFIMGCVERAYLCKHFSFDLLTESNENCLIKNMKMKKDKDDASGMFIKLKVKGKITPWDKGEMKSRYFVVSNRFLYEYV